MFKAIYRLKPSSVLLKDPLRICIEYCKVQNRFNLNQDRGFSSNTDNIGSLLDLLNNAGDANTPLRFVDYTRI